MRYGEKQYSYHRAHHLILMTNTPAIVITGFSLDQYPSPLLVTFVGLSSFVASNHSTIVRPIDVIFLLRLVLCHHYREGQTRSHLHRHHLLRPHQILRRRHSNYIPERSIFQDYGFLLFFFSFFLCFCQTLLYCFISTL
jgi:hypothetical protein